MKNLLRSPYNAALLFIALPIVGHGAGLPLKLEDIEVNGEHLEQRSLVGESDSATEGVVLAEQLTARPVSRAAELLEFVPGMIATQHSGEGKANQYYLRGFNLDHGTDFAMTVEGMPVNMRTHGHGQGYADLNFLIPELVNDLSYRKGPYYADTGDFGTAGSANFEYAQRLPRTLELGAGEFGFARALLSGSQRAKGADLFWALDYSNYDGPFDLKQDTRKTNGVLKYSNGNRLDGLSVTAMVYDNRWNAPDQIPLRAVEQGRLTRFGSVDPTAGGESHRYSVSVRWRRHSESGRHVSLSGYAIDSSLDLFSNFTYFLEDATNGDQFEQVDRRHVYGASGHYHRPLSAHSSLEVGFQTRHDDIHEVGLFRTHERVRLSTVRRDSVSQTSMALYAEASAEWSDWARTVIGVRYDHMTADVTALIADNSGTVSGSQFNPKLSLIFGPWQETEFFVNAGRGFHSNDARGTTISVDPADGFSTINAVPLLASAIGFDVGLRTAAIPRTQIALSAWSLDLDSELVFVGDAGGTEVQGATKRQGVELSIIHRSADSLILDADYAYSKARFTGAGNANAIPNAIEHVASLGLTYHNEGPLTVGLRARYFGPAPLVDDASKMSQSTFVLNGEAAWRVNDRLEFTLAAFNLLDSDDADITYFYASQLAREVSAVEDFHFHPVEPRNVRIGLTWRF